MRLIQGVLTVVGSTCRRALRPDAYNVQGSTGVLSRGGGEEEGGKRALSSRRAPPAVKAAVTAWLSS